MKRKKETKVINGVKWFRYEGDDFWATDSRKLSQDDLVTVMAGGSPVSGKATFSATGPQMLLIGIPFNDLDLYAGPRDGVTETNQLLAVGHADSGKQFCHTTRDSSSETIQTKCMRLKDGAGNVVLEFNISGGWGTAIMTCNVTVANVNYPFELVART